jgi:hypothetical protein
MTKAGRQARQCYTACWLRGLRSVILFVHQALDTLGIRRQKRAPTRHQALNMHQVLGFTWYRVLALSITCYKYFVCKLRTISPRTSPPPKTRYRSSRTHCTISEYTIYAHRPDGPLPPWEMPSLDSGICPPGTEPPDPPDACCIGGGDLVTVMQPLKTFAFVAAMARRRSRLSSSALAWTFAPPSSAPSPPPLPRRVSSTACSSASALSTVRAS